jgi:hypothetical protein
MLNAGCRLAENFRTPDGKPIHAIPMGNSVQESYDNLMAAFSNKQPSTNEEKAFQPPKIK